MNFFQSYFLRDYLLRSCRLRSQLAHSEVSANTLKVIPLYSETNGTCLVTGGRTPVSPKQESVLKSLRFVPGISQLGFGFLLFLAFWRDLLARASQKCWP